MVLYKYTEDKRKLYAKEPDNAQRQLENPRPDVASPCYNQVG